MSSLRTAHYGAGAAVGLLVGLTALAPSFIVGTGGRWIHSDNDLNIYLIAWNYFIADGWRFPLFSIPHMGYPEGGSVLLSDAVPIASLVSKVLFHAGGWRVNPFGWWILLCFILQAMTAVRLVRALGDNSWWSSVAAATFAVCSMAFVLRVPQGHLALCAQFVVIWSLAMYFECVQQGAVPPWELALLSAFVLLVNPYLFTIVTVIQLTTVLAVFIDIKPTWRFWLRLVIPYSVVVAIGLIGGYGAIVRDARGMRIAGFGLYSWNPITMLVPPAVLWDRTIAVVRDATGGQYEGEAYLGAGALFLLVVALWLERAHLVAAIRRHRVLSTTFVLLAIFAASNKIYVERMPVATYHVPWKLEGLASVFRVSGRFIWPLMYLLILGPIAWAQRRLRRGAAIGLTVVAMILQGVEAWPAVHSLRGYSGESLRELIETERIRQWLLEHDKLWQFPSWDCGGLVSTRAFKNRGANQELQLELLAAQLGKPSNSVVMGRFLKDCAVEASWGQNPKLDPNVLYVFGRDWTRVWPRLAALAASSACRSTDWGSVCSLSWMSPGTSPSFVEPP